MPFRPGQSLLRVDVPALHTIDTSSVDDLFGMWSLFSKTSHVVEDGKRLENLSWRLWNRETFCCAPTAPRHNAFTTPRSTTARSNSAAVTGPLSVPALSSSLDSASSSSSEEEDSPLSPHQRQQSSRNATYVPHIQPARPELRRNESAESSRSRGREKHITPTHLEKMVITIKKTKHLQPIELATLMPSPLPLHPSVTAAAAASASHVLSTLDLSDCSRPRDAPQTTPTPHTSSPLQPTLLESSASTVDTNASQTSDFHTLSSQASSSTEMSTHSIVRGFVPGGAPSSYRSQTHLATQPAPILKTSPQYRQLPLKKKGAMFTIGTSSGEDESSLESHMYRSQLSQSLKQSGSLQSDHHKKTSFQDEIAVGRAASRNSPVFESDDEDEDVSESAIEDEDDSSDWEDSDDQSGPSSVNEKEMFQRVDSRPDLTSRRSLLTTLIHEPDRAKALAEAASRSTTAIRRSRTTSPSGPSVATSPVSSALLQVPEQHDPTKSKPIIMTTSNMHHQLALSPRTTRRNMLSTELTESLRKNLLWERQHRSTGNLAALKRRHTANDMQVLKQLPEPGLILSDNDPTKKFTNDYFHAGLGEYHQTGW